MSDNGKQQPGLDTPGRVAFLETLMAHSDDWQDNSAIFIQHLDDSDPQVRATAIRGLWDYPDLALIDTLVEMASQDPAPEVRARAISGLGIYVHEGELADYGFDWGEIDELMREDELSMEDWERVKAFLLDAYADETRTLDERRFAIEALGFLSDPAITDLVEQVYRRPEREMKISALFAMGRSGLVRWLEILREALYDDDLEIQLEAIRAVGQIGFEELGKDLMRLAFSEQRDVRIEAIYAVGQTGWMGAFEHLEDLSMDPDREIAETAEAALGEWLWMRELLDGVELWDGEGNLDDEGIGE